MVWWYGLNLCIFDLSISPTTTRIMNEVLDIIYTHENGQNQLSIPLASLLCLRAFNSKHTLEVNLLAFYYCGTTFREVGGELVEPAKLVKISTCIYTNSDFLPDWYGDWNGKFYYND